MCARGSAHPNAVKETRVGTPCKCFGAALLDLKPEFASLLQRADLAEEPRGRMAVDLGITANSLIVRLHRARQALKSTLERSCTACIGRAAMTQGGSLTTLSFLGAEKVVDHYNVMGPVKAALESLVRYLAHELGPKTIRVNAISAGAIPTRASSGIEHFDKLIDETVAKAPLRRTVTSDEVVRAALLLASDYTTSMTGEVLHVDAGFNVAVMVFH